MQLKDVAVLITGGGSGLGAATARAMAAKGAKVAVIDQNKDNAEKVAAEAVADVVAETDESARDSVQTLLRLTLARLGPAAAGQAKGGSR